MSDKTKYLLRTNVALTTNVKLTVSSKYNLYLESYNSNELLNDNKYKRFNILPDSFLSERISKFYKDMPIDSAFEVRNDIDSDKVELEYKNQYDDIYFSGAMNVEYNKHQEEFQYNTTLKIAPRKLPKYFFIFRIHGTGIDTNDYSDISEDIRMSKLVHVTDMNPYTDLGKFLQKNYIDDDEIPVAPFELNLNQFEFSKWNGYNYYTGGTISKSMFLDDFMSAQDNDFDFEKYIVDGFKNNGVISSNFLNLAHLFDDTITKVFNKDTTYQADDYPFIHDMFNKDELDITKFNFIYSSDNLTFTVTEDIVYSDRWKINRYMGLYVDELNKLTEITPYITTGIIEDDPDIEIIDNIFYKYNQYHNPLKSGYNENIPIYLKIGENFKLVERRKIFNEDTQQYEIDGSFHIVSDSLYSGNLMETLEKFTKSIKIEYSEHPDPNENIKRNYIFNYDNSRYDNFLLNHSDGILIIEFYDEFYKLNWDEYMGERYYYVQTDNIISCNNAFFNSVGIDNNIFESTKVTNKDMNIPYYKIFDVQFTDVEDFDFDHIHTDYANYEYEKTIISNNDTTTTDISKYENERPAFYEYDLGSGIPKNLRVEENLRYTINYQGQEIKLFTYPFVIPASSEYSANGDLFIIDDLNLTDIWNLNQYVNKFVFSGSNDINSLPYKINNSLEFWGVNNRGFDITEEKVSIYSHNLDWFYSFGTPIENILDAPIDLITDTYSNRQKYEYEYYRTLNVDLQEINNITDSVRLASVEFNYDDYLHETKFDYLKYFLDRPAKLNISDGETIYKKVNRFATFNLTDEANGSLFMYKSLVGFIHYNNFKNNNTGDKAYRKVANDLTDYKMSAIFTRRETNDDELYGQGGIDFVLNKYHNHFLICVYIYVPYGEHTTIEYSSRDLIYQNNDYILMSSGDDYVRTKIRPSDITLANIHDIMKNNFLEHEAFDEINYIILDEETLHTIDSVKQKISGSDIYYYIRLTNATNLEAGDIVNIASTDYIIRKKHDNYTIVIRGASGLPFSSGVTFYNATCVQPFVFQMMDYNKIALNLNVNTLSKDNAKITPSNSIKYLNDKGKDIVTTPEDNCIYPIFDNNNIIINKTTDISKLNNPPTHYINRYSGYYEPKIKSLNLFNNYRLDELWFENNTVLYIDGVYDYIQNRIIVDANNHDLSSIVKYYEKLMIYSNFGDNAVDASNYLTSILNLEYDKTSNEYYIYINNHRNIINSSPIHFCFLIKKEENSLFDFKLHNSGTIEELIIAKVDTDMINTRDIRLLYPKIDEHGMSYIPRSVFKSNWNNSFFYKKEKNTYKLI